MEELDRETSKQDRLVEKWSAVLDAEGETAIQDKTRRKVTACLLENTQRDLIEQKEQLMEAGHINYSGGLGSSTNVDKYDPVLISLVRRAAPNLMGFDVAGVQPMNGPVGLIFYMKARYQTGSDNDLTDDTEALYDEADTDFTGTGTHAGADPSVLNDSPAGTYTTGTGMTTTAGEALGASGGGTWSEMGFTIEKTSVEAKTRALKAEYTLELAQDLKAIHGLDAENELANILTQEVISELNREVVRTIYITAEAGAQTNISTAGTFDFNTDSGGRHLGEKYNGLLMRIEIEANTIAKRTRRGKGNVIICSSDVASALGMTGKLAYAPSIEGNLNVDDTGNTFVGVLLGRYKVYIDPYVTGDYLVVGYRGPSQMDAGIFYAPYVPLTMMRAVGENTFQPKIAFKTRYGMVSNPFANASGTAGALTANVNKYYRRIKVTNIM